MKITVYGAGAVGGHFAVRLARAGHDVSVIVRGHALDAISRKGLTLIVGHDHFHADVRASDDAADLGPQDLVISTLKSTALGALTNGVQPLLGDETPVIFAQNGIPWWYNHGLAAGDGRPDLEWLDPGNSLASRIGIRRTIGGVIFSSNEVVEPGVVRNDSPDQNALFVGEPDCAASQRVATIRSMLAGAGLASPEVADVREILWRKLVANATVSVLCMVTGQTARAAVESPLLTEMVERLMTEAKAICTAQGYVLPQPPPGFRAPDHKPSLLQDFILKRPLELDALVTAPAAFARASAVATPTLDTLGAIVRHMASEAGLYPPLTDLRAP